MMGVIRRRRPPAMINFATRKRIECVSLLMFRGCISVAAREALRVLLLTASRLLPPRLCAALPPDAAYRLSAPGCYDAGSHGR